MAKARRPYRGYLTKRRGRWAVKVSVPKDIVESGRYLTANGQPRTSVVRVLEAGSHGAALAEARPVVDEIRANFADILKGLPVSDASAERIAIATGEKAYNDLRARRLQLIVATAEDVAVHVLDERRFLLVLAGDVVLPPVINPAAFGGGCQDFVAKSIPECVHYPHH